MFLKRNVFHITWKCSKHSNVCRGDIWARRFLFVTNDRRASKMASIFGNHFYSLPLPTAQRNISGIRLNLTKFDFNYTIPIDLAPNVILSGVGLIKLGFDMMCYF